MPLDSTSKNPLEAFAQKLYPRGGSNRYANAKRPQPAAHLRQWHEDQKKRAGQHVSATDKKGAK